MERHTEHLYTELVKLGCDVTVIARAPYVGEEPFEYQGVKVLPIKCPRSKFLEVIVHTYKGIFKAKKIKADIVHVHAIGPALCVPLARLLGLKIVFTHHGPDYERKKWNALAKAVLMHGEWKGCRFSHEVICISKHIAESIKAKFKRDAHIIPNGVKVPQLAGSDEALKQYGLEKGKYILTVGRFVPEKGCHDLVEAFASTARGQSPNSGDSPPRWKLVIVGDADHEDDYSKGLRAKAEGRDNVVLTGRLTGQPLEELYSHAGLFVLPSYYEGLPIVLLEAMSYGLSCLVSDIPANREVGLENQRYFKPGDIEELSGKLRAFMAISLNEEEKQAQISKVAQKYDWGKIALKTLEVYKKVIGDT